MLILLFSFLYAFIRNGSAVNKKMKHLSGQNCADHFNVSQITFIGPTELFRKGVANIEFNSETNLFGECFFEANLQFRQPLSSLNILQLSPITIVRKVLKAMKRIQVEFECWHFVAPGLYRLSLSNFISAASEWLQINGSKSAIQLQIPPVSALFPFCQNAFSISWTLPNCEKAKELLDFRLRVLASLNEPNENGEMLYLEEFLLNEPIFDGKSLQELSIDSRQRNVPSNFLRIPCTKFDIIHEQFCFELVSISGHNQRHQQWDRKCVRTEAITAQSNDGFWEWSDWSEWAKCTCQQNEAIGTRKRMRHCRRSNANFMERTTVGSLTKSKAKAAFGRGGGCRGGQIMQSEQCDQRECRNGGEIVPAQNFPFQPSLLMTDSTLLVASSLGQSMPNLTFAPHQKHPSAASANNRTFQCLCGCKLSEERHQGMFFASLCPMRSAGRWQLEFGRPFRAQIILSDRLMDGDNLAFEVIRDDGEEKETLWRSGQNNPRDESENVIIEAIFEKAALFELRIAIGVNGGDQIEFGRRRKGKKRKHFGILVEYKIIAFEEISSNFFAELWSANTNFSLVRKFCSEGQKFAQCSVLLAFCSLLFLLSAVFMPPIVFVCIAKRHTRQRLARQSAQIYSAGAAFSSAGESNSRAMVASTHCPNQIDDELIRSNGTDSTKVSNSLVISAKRKSLLLTEEAHRITSRNVALSTVELRSIGIQLSHHSTPRCASRQFRSRQCRSSSNCNEHRTSDHSNGSIESATIGDEWDFAEDYWNEDDDFGAEQLQLGGRRGIELEDWPFRLVFDIDIDELLRRESADWKRRSILRGTGDQKDAATQSPDVGKQ